MKLKINMLWGMVLVLMLNFTSVTTHALQAEQCEIPTVNELMNMDLREPCGLTAEQLEKGLTGELKELAQYYIDAEEKYGVNAVYRAATDGTESGWGSECHAPNNLSGFYTEKDFSTKEECIDYVTRKIYIWYLVDPKDSKIDCYPLYLYSDDDIDSIGQYFQGYTLKDVSKKYNPANKHYDKYIAGIMQQIYYNSLIEENLTE